MNLLVATHNSAKFDYFKRILLDCFDFDLELLSLDDLKIFDNVEEDGVDEAENAIKKAKFYTKLSNKIALSDDAGLYIDELDNEPGVQARRWGGLLPDDISDKEWLEFFLNKTKHIPFEKRTGEFRIVRAIYTPEGKNVISVLKRKFVFMDKPDWTSYKKGWPMSTLYLDTEFQKPWIEMSNQDLAMREKIFLKDLKKFINKIK